MSEDKKATDAPNEDTWLLGESENGSAEPRRKSRPAKSSIEWLSLPPPARADNEGRGRRSETDSEWLTLPPPAEGDNESGGRRSKTKSDDKRSGAGDRRPRRRSTTSGKGPRSKRTDRARKQRQLEAKIKSLEAELAEIKNGDGRERSASSGLGGRSSDQLDLNAASFEQLRRLGLSTSEAARVISYREFNDGFATVDDLQRIPGLSKGMLRDLTSRLYVPPQ